MLTLGELYTSFDTLSSLGLDTTELKLLIQNKEREILEKDIIPSLQEIVDLLCKNLRSDVEFTIKHQFNNSADIKLDLPHVDSLKESGQNQSEDTSFVSDKFYVKNKMGAYGIGLFNPVTKTFKLLAGSIINGNPYNSVKYNESYKNIISNYCEQKDDVYILNCDYSFSSPSTASSVVLGRSSNGWTDWKNESGISLSEIYRK